MTRLAVASLATALAACSGGGGTSSDAGPSLALSTTSLSFSYEAGGAAPAAKTLTVANAGGGTLVRPSAAIAYAKGDGWLAATVSGSAAPFTVTVQAQPGILAPGTYAATLSLSSDGAGGSRDVSISLTVDAPAPRVQLSTTAVAFPGVAFRGDPEAQTVAVSNAGPGELAVPTVRVEYQQGADWLDGDVTGTAAPYLLRLRPRIAGLRAGTYLATVHVESPGATSQPLSVSLTLSPSWTVVVYGSADNDRSTALVRDIAAMGLATLGDAVTVLVAADYSAGRMTPAGEPFPSGTEWWRIVGGGHSPVLFGALAEQDLDDPAVLAASMSDAFYLFPSERHAVLLWGPGASWLGFGGDEQDTPADPSDDGGRLTPSAIAGALSTALTNLGRPTFDLVGFDASLMISQEVAFELRDVADVLVASADVEGGWDYRATLSRLGADPSLSAVALAQGEVQDWSARHPAQAELGGAHAALDLRAAPAYADAWSGLAAAITGSASLDALELARDVFAASPAYGVEVGAPVPRPALRDAGQLLFGLGGVTTDAGVAAAAGAARQALANLVVARALGGARATPQAGLGLEATLGASWPARAEAYGALAWNARTAWGDVLWLLAGQDSGKPPTVEHTAIDASSPDVLHPPTIRFRAADADVAAARVDLARVIGGHTVSLGAIAELAAAPGATYERAWDGNVLALHDRAGSASDVFVQPWVRGAAGAASLLPGLIRDGPTELEAYAVLVDGATAVDAVLVRASGALAAMRLDDFAGLEFVPLRFDATDGLWVPATPLAIPSEAAAFAVERTSGDAGTYRLLTSMTDVWGNTATASDDVTVVTPFGT